jgi:Cns1/TTC4 Wheel domain
LKQDESLPADMLHTIHSDIGYIHYIKGNYGKSRDALKLALSHFPGDRLVSKRLALTLEALENYDEALNILSTMQDSLCERSGEPSGKFVNKETDQHQYENFEGLLERLRVKHAEQVNRRRSKEQERQSKENILSVRHITDLTENLTLLNSYVPAEYIRDLPSWTFDAQEDTLTLPMIFLYPPYGTFDILGQVSEHSILLDHLELMFEQRAPWDEQDLYSLGNGFRAFLPLQQNDILEVDVHLTFNEMFTKVKKSFLIFPKHGATTALNYYDLVKQS